MSIPTLYVTRAVTRYATKYVTKGVVTNYYKLSTYVDDKGVTHVVTQVVARHTELFSTHGKPVAVSSEELARVLKKLITTT
ncbi:MAG: hypothetical protein GXO43_05900 [Crenarchaeota archaeon]|nr:hypothetical protein [Thermoproteota archaeon]